MLVEALTEHYQNTYELTYRYWVQRNRTFLLLLTVIAIASFITFGSPNTDSIMVFIIAKFIGVTDAAGRNEIQQGFSFTLIQSVLLFLVLYLMVNLHHRSDFVLRNYQYLGRLEQEIRVALNLNEDSVAFSRESGFYWKSRSWGSAAVKWVYILLLGLLLIIFLGGRLYNDLISQNYYLLLAELIIAIATLLFYIAYAFSSVKLDYNPQQTNQLPTGDSAVQANQTQV